MFDKINLRGGIVTYNTFNIDLSKSASSQIDELREDLLQIQYKNRYTIDVGWYPMSKPHGFFCITVIEDCDWDEPLLEIKVDKFENFIESLQEAIDFIDRFIQENPNRPLRESALD